MEQSRDVVDVVVGERMMKFQAMQLFILEFNEIVYFICSYLPFTEIVGLICSSKFRRLRLVYFHCNSLFHFVVVV